MAAELQSIWTVFVEGRYETVLWFTKSDDYIFHLDSVRVPAKYPGKLHFKGDKKGQPSGNLAKRLAALER